MTSAHGKPAGPGVLEEVNEVCRAVRDGAPSPLSVRATPVAVARYARAARPVAQRTIVSLERLAAQKRTSTLARVIDGYMQLQGAYASIAANGSPRAPVAHQEALAIQQHEQIVTAASLSGGVPACGVAGR